MKVGDRILTDDGLATIKILEHYRGKLARVGLLYDIAPVRFKQSLDCGLFKDNIIYHYPAEIKDMPIVNKNEMWLFDNRGDLDE
jgi:hypothetical protein